MSKNTLFPTILPLGLFIGASCIYVFAGQRMPPCRCGKEITEQPPNDQAVICPIAAPEIANVGICSPKEIPIRNTVHLKSDNVGEMLLMINGLVVGAEGDGQYHDALFGWNGLKASVRNRNVEHAYTRNSEVTRRRRDPLIQIAVRLKSDVGEWKDVIPIPSSEGVPVQMGNGVSVTLLVHSFRQNRVLIKISAPETQTIDAVQLKATEEHEQRYAGYLRAQLFDFDHDSNWVIIEEYKADNPIKIRYWKPSDNAFDSADVQERKEEHRFRFGNEVAIDGEARWVFDGDFLIPVGNNIPRGERWLTTKSWIHGLGAGNYELDISGVFTFSGYATNSALMSSDIENTFFHEAQRGGGGGFQDAIYRFDHIRKNRPPVYASYLGPDRDYRFKVFFVDKTGRAEQIRFQVFMSDGSLLDRSARDELRFHHDHRYKLRVDLKGPGSLRFFIDDKSIINSSGGVARQSRIYKSWDNAGALIIHAVKQIGS